MTIPTATDAGPSPRTGPQTDLQADPAGDAGARPLLIHVGYHKTATTWLQHSLFLPEHGFHVALDHDAVFAALIAPHGLDFDPAPVRAALAAGRAEAQAGAAVDVLSLEALSGLPYDGGRESDAYARRLAAVAPKARILITIREQKAILASVYMQHVRRAGTAPPRRFFDEAPFRGYTKFAALNFHYDRLIGLYQALFGARNVLVLPQETVAADQALAVRRIAAFAGHDRLATTPWRRAGARGISDPQFAIPVLRRINHVRRDALNPEPAIDLGRAGDLAYRGAGWLARTLPWPGALRRWRPVSAEVARRYDGSFGESNRRLAAMLAHPADLSGYEGFAVPDRTSPGAAPGDLAEARDTPRSNAVAEAHEKARGTAREAPPIPPPKGRARPSGPG